MRSLADLVRRAARHDPGRRAFVAGSDVLTWRELDAAVDRVAGALAGHGLTVGDRLAMRMQSTLEFPVVYFAALRAGLVVVPVSPEYTDRELAHVLTDSGARGLVTGVPGEADPDGVRRLRGLGEALEHVLDPVALVAGAADPAGELPAADPDRLALLIYTSGTSGAPKGAMLTHRALLANLEQCARIVPTPVTGHDVVLLVLPLFHTYGLGPGLGQVAWAGATGILVERFDPIESLRLMAEHRVSNVAGAPQMYVAWAAVDRDLVTAGFAGVRVATSGAAPLPAGALNAIRAATGVTIWEGYGLTETAPVLTSTMVGRVAKPGSIGRPVPGVELALWDEDGDPIDEDADDEDSAGDTGEIAVRGANVFSGYWPDGRGGPDGDGWFATGDIAYVDDDGDLFLVERRLDLVLVNGFNVYPREVENVLLGLGGVAETAVLGVSHQQTGETILAYVVRTADEAGAALTEDAVRYHAAAHLARFKCPTIVEFVDELPHSATGKVRKGELRAGRDG